MRWKKTLRIPRKQDLSRKNGKYFVMTELQALKYLFKALEFHIFNLKLQNQKSNRKAGDNLL